MNIYKKNLYNIIIYMNEDQIDIYSHRLSIKNKICYENANSLLKKSLKKLKKKKYNSNDIIRSAYKHARIKLQKGGYSDKSDDEYLQKYLKYKQKYLELRN